MKHGRSFPFVRRSRWEAFALGIAILILLSIPAAFGEGGRKGPEVEAVPDLEEAIRPDGASSAPDPAEAIKETAEPARRSASSAGKSAAPAGDPDLESLSDLEKVIEMEDSKPASVAKNNGARSAKEPADDLREITAQEEDPGSVPLEAQDTAPSRSLQDPVPSLEESQARRPRARASSESSRSSSAPRRSSAAMPDGSIRNTITNLEFKMEGTGSRLIVTARSPLKYREVKNAGMRQVVYYFDNTETPEKLQRAYDTTEFTSAVGLFTLLQIPGEKPPASKLVIQLREDKEPSVVASERGITIDFGAPTNQPPRVASGGGVTSGKAKTLLDGDLYLGNQSFNGRRIKRLEIKNSDVSDVLRLVAKSSGYNLVVGDDVSGKVNTLSLENVPWDQAFALVLQSKKLGFVLSGNVIRVATLNSLKQEKEEALQGEQARIKIETLRTVLVPISFAKASDLATQGKNFLTPRGSIDVDNRTNTIIVKDIDKVVARIQKLFTALDTAPPRVAISARFVEVSKAVSNQLNSILSLATNFSGLNLNATSSFAAGGNTLQITAPQFANLSAKFDLLEKEDLTRTLANPSVTVVANQKASVNQSFSFFVPGADQAAVGVLAVPILKQITANLQLDVTPIVAGDGSIFMNLAIKNEIPHPSGANTTIDGRNVTTQVLVDNGDTAVVGGVFSNTFFKTQSGLPILRSIPVIGSLFGSQSENLTRSEVFIFITAKITNAEDSFRRNL